MANKISPVFFVGIGIYILPIIFLFFGLDVPKYLYTFGLIVIVIAILHTFMLQRKK
jgi:hypothetical protein